MGRHRISIFVFVNLFNICVSSNAADAELDEKEKFNHRIDSLNILLYTFLLTLTVVITWMFKHKRVRFIHETGLLIMFGKFIYLE